MILKVFTVRDSKSEVFNQPFFQRSHGEAERNFRTLVGDATSNISKYPEDYDLYYLGEYDDLSGKMSILDTPQHVVKAVNAVAKN